VPVAGLPAVLSNMIFFLFLHLLLASVAFCLRFDKQFVGYNLNENEAAVNPLDYSGEWTDHTFHPSPTNWRFPFYTLFLDRYVNGDPANDDINGTVYEKDSQSNQLRHGGDLVGLVDSLDYIQGLGIKVSKPEFAGSYTDTYRPYTSLVHLSSMFRGTRTLTRP
jgi:alpha-1,3-glucan synthase